MPFVIGELNEEHPVGDPECGECWRGYPIPHEGCTGLLHATFGEENYDSVWLRTKCDVCGESE